MRRSTAAMFAVTLALAAVNAASGQGRTRTIKGTVVDWARPKQVSQAAIFIGRMFTGQRTGDDGTFHVSAPQGPLVVMIRRPGYIPVLTALAGDTSGTDTDMGAANTQQVKSDADRAAVQDADMKIYPELSRFYDHKARYRQGFFFQAEDGIRDRCVTGVQTCALPIWSRRTADYGRGPPCRASGSRRPI